MENTLPGMLLFVCDTVAPSYLNITSVRSGSAAERSEQVKRHKYRDLLLLLKLGLGVRTPMTEASGPGISRRP